LAAVTLQAADLGDTVTLDATPSKAGIAVAELLKREAAEQRPEDTPKVNVEGIEEMVADKGYHRGGLGADEELRSAYLHSGKETSGRATGRAKPRRNRRCTRIDGGCAAATAKAYCGGEAS
jgi:hypothetical protein